LNNNVDSVDDSANKSSDENSERQPNVHQRNKILLIANKKKTMKAASSNKTIVQMFLLVVAIDVIVLRLQQTMQLSDKNVFFLINS
jgi:hypothetical protein